MLLALTLSTMLLAGVAALGSLPWWSPLIGVLLATLFVVHLRQQARRSLLVDRRRQSLTRSALSHASGAGIARTGYDALASGVS